MGGGGGGGTTDELLFGDLGVIPPLKRPVGLNGVVAIFPMKDGEVGDGLSLKTNKEHTIIFKQKVFNLVRNKHLPVWREKLCWWKLEVVFDPPLKFFNLLRREKQ